MGLTLSHLSALDVMRTIRSNGINLQEMDTTRLTRPTPWEGKQWSMKEFKSPSWQWGVPTATDPLHVLVFQRQGRPRMAHVITHNVRRTMPPQSILWVDECASIVCPEVLFLQMACVFSFPALVMLGYELCGNFSRSAIDPLNGHVTMDIPAATSVESIRDCISTCSYKQNASLSLRAINYVSNHALSAPEAVLAMMYSLPADEAGYNMGRVTLNKRVCVNDEDGNDLIARHRYPDIMFSFAPVGINYDGEGHLDLSSLEEAIRHTKGLEGTEYEAARNHIYHELNSVREKVLDDNMRNRELAATGRIVLSATKEDLYGRKSLDNFTRQILRCAHNTFGANVQKYLRILDDTDATRDRNELLESFLPGGRPFGASHGKI